jgi:hypothetical protein
MSLTTAYRQLMALAHAVRGGGVTGQQQQQYSAEILSYLEWEERRFRRYAEMFAQQDETMAGFIEVCEGLAGLSELTIELRDHGQAFGPEDWASFAGEAESVNRELVENVEALLN